MRIHKNRALFVSGQKNAQRRNLEQLILRSSPPLSAKLRAARLLYFPETSDFLKGCLPTSTDSVSSGLQLDVRSTPAEVLEQIEGFVSNSTETEVLMVVGEIGDVWFCDEHFVDLAFPIFATLPSHWAGFLAELFELGGQSLTFATHDGSRGITTEIENDCCSKGISFQIRCWS